MTTFHIKSTTLKNDSDQIIKPFNVHSLYLWQDLHTHILKGCSIYFADWDHGGARVGLSEWYGGGQRVAHSGDVLMLSLFSFILIILFSFDWFFLFIACWFWFYMYLWTFYYFLSISKRWGTGVLLFYIGWKVFLFVGGGYLNIILIFFKWGE